MAPATRPRFEIPICDLKVEVPTWHLKQSYPSSWFEPREVVTICDHLGFSAETS